MLFYIFFKKDSCIIDKGVWVWFSIFFQNIDVYVFLYIFFLNSFIIDRGVWVWLF